MSQIWVQWSHFWRLLVTVDFDDGFNTKVCSVDNIIIVVYINGVGYMGSSKMSQIWVYINGVSHTGSSEMSHILRKIVFFLKFSARKKEVFLNLSRICILSESAGHIDF